MDSDIVSRLRGAVRRKRPEEWTVNSWFLLHNNAPAHRSVSVNPLNTELNPICYLLALLGACHIFHVSGLRVKAFVTKNNVTTLEHPSYSAKLTAAAF